MNINDINEIDFQDTQYYRYCLSGEGDPYTDVVRSTINEVLSGEYVYLVRSVAVDAKNKVYNGFITYNQGGEIGRLQPHFWIDKKLIKFWRGLKTPGRSELDFVRDLLPMRYESSVIDDCGRCVVGFLDGIYYKSGNEVRCAK